MTIVRFLFDQDYLDSGCDGGVPPEGTQVDNFPWTYGTNFAISLVCLVCFGIIMSSKPPRTLLYWSIPLYFLLTSIGHVIAGVNHLIIETVNDPELRPLEISSFMIIGIANAFLLHATSALLLSRRHMRLLIQGPLVLIAFAGSLFASAVGNLEMYGFVLVGTHLFAAFVFFFQTRKENGPKERRWWILKGISQLILFVALILHLLLKKGCDQLEDYAKCFEECRLPAHPHGFNHNALFHIVIVLGNVLFAWSDVTVPAAESASDAVDDHTWKMISTFWSRLRSDLSLSFFGHEEPTQEGFLATSEDDMGGGNELQESRCDARILDMDRNFCLGKGIFHKAGIFKLVFLLVTLATLIQDAILCENARFYAAYLTRWGLIFATLYFLASCSLVFFKKARSRAASFVIKFAWLGFSVSSYWSSVTLFYWVNPDHDQMEFAYVSAHGITFLMLMVDGLLINRTPVRLKHILVNLALTAMYSAWTIIQNLVLRYNPDKADKDDIDDDAIYDLLKWQASPGWSVVLVVYMHFIYAPFFQTLTWRLSLRGRHYYAATKCEGKNNNEVVGSTQMMSPSSDALLEPTQSEDGDDDDFFRETLSEEEQEDRDDIEAAYAVKQTIDHTGEVRVVRIPSKEVQRG